MRFKYEQIQDVWNNFLTAETITEPISSVRNSDDVSIAIKLMDNNGYDVLGLEDENYKVIGYIERKEGLEGICQDHNQIFAIDDLISLQTPLKNVMFQIADKKRLFVLGGNGVEGIITLADLHKQPVRMFLFSIISLLEMTMAKLI